MNDRPAVRGARRSGFRTAATEAWAKAWIAALRSAPVDGYGVGTQLVVGSGHPTVGLVYKLVAREDADGELVGVAKRSSAKESWPGRHWARRRHDANGVATEEVVGTGATPPLADGERDLLVPLVRGGEVVGREPLDAAALRAFASGRLAHYKIPRYVHLVDEFPMTVTGKIRKVDMRAESTRLLGL
mgnify:CR=1 FL=1